jgi:F0F1-type ATP synthase delta subunit
MDRIDLSDFFTTKAESVDFATRLQEISKQIYETDFNLENSLLSHFGIQKKDKFLSLVRNNEINLEKNSILMDFIKQVLEKISTLPTVSLTLAFEPQKDTLHALSEWFILNINHQVLLDINIDPKLIAGAAINFNGKYKDYSAKSKFSSIVASVSL